MIITIARILIINYCYNVDYQPFNDKKQQKLDFFLYSYISVISEKKMGHIILKRKRRGKFLGRAGFEPA